MGNQKLHVEEWTIQDGRQNEIKKQNKQTMANKTLHRKFKTEPHETH